MLALLLLTTATTASAGEITATVAPTESQAVLLPSWLADLNAGLCQQARLPATCKTEQLQQAAQRADVRIYASLDEWGTEVLRQAIATAARQQAERLRALSDSADLPALQAAVRKELGK